MEGVYIVNLKNESSTVSEKNGYFAINARVGDTLLFSAVQFVGLKMVLKEADFKSGVLLVKLETMVNMLDEVTVQKYRTINSVSLGLVSKNKREYTPAERKLITAGEFHWYSPLLIPVGGMSVDGLLNSISGRTSQLKKELQVEKKELLLKKIDYLFEEKYFVEVLKIPVQNVKGFHYYLVEDQKFVAALNNKNKTMATFLMGELAVNYKAIIEQQ